MFFYCCCATETENIPSVTNRISMTSQRCSLIFSITFTFIVNKNFLHDWWIYCILLFDWYKWRCCHSWDFWCFLHKFLTERQLVWSFLTERQLVRGFLTERQLVRGFLSERQLVRGWWISLRGSWCEVF